MAREARRQQRFADAYVELLCMVERMGHWAILRPMLETSPPRPVPPMPDAAEQTRCGP
jgi:hypothetical protein